MQDLKSTSSDKPRFDPGEPCETTPAVEEADLSHAGDMLSALAEGDEASSGKAPAPEPPSQQAEIPTAEPHATSAANGSASQEACPAVSLEETMDRLESCLNIRQEHKDGHCKNNPGQLGRQTGLKRPAAPNRSASKYGGSNLVGASAKAKAARSGSVAKRPATQPVKAARKKAVSGQKAKAKAAPKKKPGPSTKRTAGNKKSDHVKMTKKDVYSRQYHKSMSLSS